MACEVDIIKQRYADKRYQRLDASEAERFLCEMDVHSIDGGRLGMDTSCRSSWHYVVPSYLQFTEMIQ